MHTGLDFSGINAKGAAAGAFGNYTLIFRSNCQHVFSNEADPFVPSWGSLGLISHVLLGGEPCWQWPAPPSQVLPLPCSVLSCSLLCSSLHCSYHEACLVDKTQAYVLVLFIFLFFWSEVWQWASSLLTTEKENPRDRTNLSPGMWLARWNGSCPWGMGYGLQGSPLCFLCSHVPHILTTPASA